MTKKEMTPIDHSFLESVAKVLTQARENAKTAVNLSMVYAYFEIGRMIVEEEQHGANRAAYGTQLLKELSVYLTEQFGKGYSAENLKLMHITNIDEWHFYEIEAVKNDWSLGELKRQYSKMYVHYCDRKVKLPDENPTISIVLCKDKNNAIVEMTLLKDYIQEHKDQGETSINGGAGIENMPFEKWLEKI